VYQQNHDGSFPQVDAYHAYVPSFGEWDFLAMNGFQTNFNTVNRQVEGLCFTIISLINSIILPKI
jgi:predicted membrane-bound spermidine synthase